MGVSPIFHRLSVAGILDRAGRPDDGEKREDAMRHYVLIAAWVFVSIQGFAAEEKIRGVLEKTAKPNACAQITDALNDIYYISKSDESEKLVAPFAGKNIRVVITGTVENKEGDPSYFLNLKSLEEYKPKMPPAAPAAVANPAAPADGAKKDEVKDEKNPEK
jgi:hypothetical protein